MINHKWPINAFSSDCAILRYNHSVVTQDERYDNFAHSEPCRTPTHGQTNDLLQHVAIIMDGNRRWAREHGLQPWEGHKAGVESLKTAVTTCLEQGINYLSVYAFSLENFKRSAEELHHIFSLIPEQLSSDDFNQLLNKGIRIRFVGDRSLFPKHLIASFESLEKQTAKNSQLTVCILFCYGGQQEIAASVRSIVSDVQAGMIDPKTITPQTVADHLWTADIPNPDLIIRSGKMHRLSNFLPFQSTYSEIYFLDCYWPEVTKEHLLKAFDEFYATKRSFGA